MLFIFSLFALFISIEGFRVHTRYVSIHNTKLRSTISINDGKQMIMNKIAESGLPDDMVSGLDHFVSEYLTAATEGGMGVEGAAENIQKCLQFGFKYGMGEDKYEFGVSHKAIRTPFDYYTFGIDFFRPAIDLENSVISGLPNLSLAMSQVASGANVVFLANHQSEADPQVVSVLMEKAGYGREAEGMTFLAGHKVTTDALAIPFSMGRNLLCIHSKKHIDSEPELKEVKQKQNLMTMGAMLDMMKKGGECLWVAPSGGRDRRDVESGGIPIADFDSKTIDMFRLMARKSKTPTHFYPMSMVSYELCPPPDTVEAGTGEKRNIRYTKIGVTVGG